MAATEPLYSTRRVSPTEQSAPAGAQHPSGDGRFALVDRAMKRFDFRRDALIEVLHTAQEAFGYLSEDLLTYVANRLQLPLSQVYGVASFYHLFSFKPLGEHTCTVCLGTACYVKRAAEVLAALERAFEVQAGRSTDDGRLSLATARCLGSCGLAPVIVLDDAVVGRLTPDQAVAKVRARLEGCRAPSSRQEEGESARSTASAAAEQAAPQGGKA